MYVDNMPVGRSDEGPVTQAHRFCKSNKLGTGFSNDIFTIDSDIKCLSERYLGISYNVPP